MRWDQRVKKGSLATKPRSPFWLDLSVSAWEQLAVLRAGRCGYGLVAEVRAAKEGRAFNAR